MRAGTIMVCDEAGSGLGLEMVRGTIMAAKAKHVKPGFAEGFRYGTTQCIPASNLILKHVEKLGFKDHGMNDRWSLFHGDLLHGGRGELLISTGH